ncbi:DNA polymerase/3'-5' exonuclease PolX, partial [bacterium]|nr:DNA polymerase/3'-5' exonuclease PolX [bacterium]
REVRAQGVKKCSVLLQSGLQVDLRVVGEKSFGAALQYFTGSKAHNLAIRSMALRRGLKVNEYGVFQKGRKIGGAQELDVYRKLGIPWVPPELREGGDELEAALAGKLPELIRAGHIRGDLHVHTRDSDGHSNVREMALAARDLGYEYLAITDHSPRLAMARGLDPSRLLRQIQVIDRLNEEMYPFRILKGCEVDILKDGSLDLPDRALEQLDLTVCSIHSHFDLSSNAQLRRVRRAMSHPGFTIFGHPSSRLIGPTRERSPIDLDIEACLHAARENRVFVEANGQPGRMDLSGEYCRRAREIGVLVALSTDAHSVHELAYMRFALTQARRGWLEPSNTLNSRSWTEIHSLIKQRRMITPKKEAA